MTTTNDTMIEQYQQQGYMVLEHLLTENEVAAVSERITAIAGGEVPEFPATNIEYEPTAQQKHEALNVRKINQCAEHDPFMMQLAKHERILNVVEQLIGPDIKLFGSQCFMKPPGGVAKPYHQDSAYFTIEPKSLVTCWIALDEVIIENGCLWVIPGSHLGELHDHSQPWQLGDRVDKQIPVESIDTNREQPIVLGRGSASFHHSMLMHRSGHNSTNKHRRGLAIHYMSAKSRWTDPAQSRPDYPLLRGSEHENCV